MQYNEYNVMNAMQWMQSNICIVMNTMQWMSDSTIKLSIAIAAGRNLAIFTKDKDSLFQWTIEFSDDNWKDQQAESMDYVRDWVDDYSAGQQFHQVQKHKTSLTEQF